MSAFDDLLNLDGPSEGTLDMSDPYSGQSASMNAGTGSGDLLDFGFDAQVSAENGGQISFEANTNPLYEFTNSGGKFTTDSTNPLFDMESEPVQKDLKSENVNLLYDFMQNESETNGHIEDGLTNGGGEVDLLGGGDVDLLGGGDQGRTQEDLFGEDHNEPEMTREEQIEEDLLGGGDAGHRVEDTDAVNYMEEGAEAENVIEDVTDTGNGIEHSGDLLEDSVPVTADDDGLPDDDFQARETIQTRSRSSSENSEPVQDDSGHVEKHSEPAEAREEDLAARELDQPSGEVLQEGASADDSVNSQDQANVDEGERDSETVFEDGTRNGEDDQTHVPAVEADAIEIPVEAKDNELELNEQQELIAEEQFNNVEAEKTTDAATNEGVVAEEQATDEPEESYLDDSCSKTDQGINEDDKENIPFEEHVTESELKKTTEEEEPLEEILQDEDQQVVTDSMEMKESGEALEEPDSNQTEFDKQTDEKEAETGQVTDVAGDEPEEHFRDGDDAEPRSPVGTDAVQDDAARVNGTSDINENGVSEEEAVRDPNIFRETFEKDEVHFAEMNNVRQKFESGGTRNEPVQRNISVKDDFAEGGEYENEPVLNPDVVKETDRPKEELPEIGTAKTLVNRFKSIQEEKSQPVSSGRKKSPPREQAKVEYESTPSEHLPAYQGQTEAGVFESTPRSHEDVVRSGDLAEDYKPEQGYAKNILGKFKEIETQSKTYKSHEKREITPDRSGKVEYVSEPRGQKIEYNETQSESGVFENVPKEEEDVIRSGDRAEEVLPEVGMAKSLLSKFKQMETESGFKPPPSPKREITPDRSGKVEYVSEPRGYLEKYEPQVESGEFESHPVAHAEVIRSGDHSEEILPEIGSAKKTMEKFKEIQRQSSSPSSGRVKEFTPPREQSPGRTVAGVVENKPAERGDVVRSGEAGPDDRPAQGTARNILNKYKEIASSGSQSNSPGRKPKEFTPPPEAGVYENTPKEHLKIETRQSESGILESTPAKSSADISRDREATPESELPEQGFAKNLVSKWKQLESTSSSAKSPSSTSPRFKEFTPPRDSRGPLSPKSPAGATNGVDPRDLPGQYQPQESSVIVENDPHVNKDVFREADTDWTEGMPAPNTTSSLLQRFRSIQDQAKEAEATPPVVHVTRKEKGMFKVVQTEKCAACQKTVYAMEKLEMNGHTYHKNCFKCSHCSARLTPKTFSMNEGVIYCVNHFKQLFARKGNYDEGFGRQLYKKKWGQGEKPEGATA